MTTLNGVKVLGLRPDYFDEKPIAKVVKGAFKSKEPTDIEITKNIDGSIDVILNEPLPQAEYSNPKPTSEELAEIEKEEKRAKLLKELAALD